MEKGNFMEQNHLSEEEIALAAEATSANTFDKLPLAIKSHIIECDKCATEVAIVSEIIDNEDIATDKVSNKNNIKKLLTIGISIAAILILMLGLFYIFNSKNDVVSEIVKSTDSTKVQQEQIIEKKQIAQEKEEVKSEPQIIDNKEEILLSYNENPNLESLYQRYNDGAMRGDEIKIISPSLLEISNIQKTFLEWENPYNEDLTIEIYNNKGEKIMETSTNKDKIQLSKINEKGLYYWKLFNSDFDLIFCGKIVFGK
jgi:hypothetical protein